MKAPIHLDDRYYELKAGNMSVPGSRSTLACRADGRQSGSCSTL